ncbi:MAG TPA: cytochrome P450 [Marmoricola sp.]|nr:cytochrome P450 [Marmoricola sp.]
MTQPYLDPYDLRYQEDPYPYYELLREQAPFYHNPERDFYAISRHSDVEHALRFDDAYSNAMGVSLDRSAWGPDAHKVMSFLALDPPDHMRMRGLISRGFTPRRVREMEPEIQSLTHLYLDPILESARDGVAEAEWIEDFAGKLPMDLISQMTGVPAADRAEVRRLADLMVYREPGYDDVPPAGMEAAVELIGYYTELLKDRKQNLGSDLVSALIEAEVEGDKLADHEIIAFLFLMVVAGNETTTKLLGNAFYHLSQHPDQMQAVFANPGNPEPMVNQWVEETLRHDTSSVLLARHLREDVTLHGVTAPAGSRVVLLLGSANRDPRVFSDPEEFNVHRDPDELSHILSFGGGRHYCLGAHLARLEARVVLNEVVRRCSAIEVEEAACKRFYSSNVRGFAHVPTRFTVR